MNDVNYEISFWPHWTDRLLIIDRLQKVKTC